MATQGWTRFVQFIAPVVLATLLSGCHSVSSGQRHPFATMFVDQPSAQITQLMPPLAEKSAPTIQTAAETTQTLY